MTVLRLCVNEHQAKRGGYSGSMSVNFGQSNLQDQWANLTNKTNVIVGQYVANNYKDMLPRLCNDWGNCNYMPSTFSYSGINMCLVISSPSQSEVDWWNNNVAGRSITLTFKRLQITFTSGAVRYVDNWIKFKVSSLPTIGTSVNYIVSEECLNWYGFETINAPYDNDTFCDIINAGNTIGSVFPNLDNYDVEYANTNCDDLRTSLSTQECLITVNTVDMDGASHSESYTLMFQPDSNHTSGIVTNIGITPCVSITGVTCRFTNGVIRDDGIIKIKGTIHGTRYGYQLGPEEIPYFDVVEEECILLQASFSPCCDYPDSYSETYSATLNSLKANVTEMLCQLRIDSIEWSGFAPLTNYCCDDSDCPNVSISYPENSTVVQGGSSGGGESGGEGGSGTDPCVCEWLESIDTKLGLIDNSLSALLCICTSLDTLTGVLRDKELSVTNQITVTPSTAQITTPVNAPVTVNPPVNQITVTPSTAQITTPVNAPVTVTPAPVTVNPTDLTGLISAINGLNLSASVTNNIDGLTCENSLGQQESLACILKNALNYSGEGLAQIHKKAFSFTDCCNIEFNLVDAFVKTDSSDCVEYTLVEEVHKLNDSVKLSSDEIIIENGLYSDVRKKYFQPFLSVDDSSIEDG